MSGKDPFKPNPPDTYLSADVRELTPHCENGAADRLGQTGQELVGQ